MIKGNIRILEGLWQDIRKSLLKDKNNESALFITAKYYKTSDKVILLGEGLIEITDTDYLYRSPYHLEVSPLYVNKTITIAEGKKSTIIMAHSHPFEEHKPSYSHSDDYGEAKTAETISSCLENHPPVGSILIGKRSANSRIWIDNKTPVPSYITVLGRNRIRFLNLRLEKLKKNEVRIFDRQLKILNEKEQKLIKNLKIGIIGLGGTGSIVAEQLVRMGAENLILVDHDTFEDSNLTRMYGTKKSDLGKKTFKVELIRRHLLEINPRINCEIIKESICKRDVLAFLSQCDFIFSCVDRQAPRAVLNELSYQCFIPVIDVGVGVDKIEGEIIRGNIRASVIGPNFPCYFCQGIITPEAITAEHLTPEEYSRRRKEHYVPDIGLATPSIISYTSMAGSLGVILFLSLLSKYKNKRLSPTVLLPIDFSLSVNADQILRMSPKIKSECVCNKRLGRGLDIPFNVAD